MRNENSCIFRIASTPIPEMCGVFPLPEALTLWVILTKVMAVAMRAVEWNLVLRDTVILDWLALFPQSEGQLNQCPITVGV